MAQLPASVGDTNVHKNQRDRIKNETVITVRDRKVQIKGEVSMYALCRSWLRNGFPERSQPQYGDVTKCLPPPLPISVTDNLPKREEEEEKDEESIELLSTQDLLKKHIGRARKVRAKLREDRLRRIARYKTRLALLLPPLVEQVRNDNAFGN